MLCSLCSRIKDKERHDNICWLEIEYRNVKADFNTCLRYSHKVQVIKSRLYLYMKRRVRQMLTRKL